MEPIEPTKPNGPQSLLRAAEAHLKSGRLVEAEAAFRRVLSMLPRHPMALRGLGIVNHQAGRQQEALALLRQAVRVTPPARAAEFRSNLAAVMGRLGLHREAAAELAEVVRLKPDYAEGHRNLGVALEHSGRREDAVGAYRQAVKLGPGDAAAHHFLGNALRSLSRADEAESAYREAVRLQPRHAGAWSYLALMLSGQGRLPEVIACRRKVAELRPNSAAAGSALLSTLQYDPTQSPADLLAEARRWAQKHAGEMPGAQGEASPTQRSLREIGETGEDACPTKAATGLNLNAERKGEREAGSVDRPLRVGFVSSNLSGHPEGRLLRPVLASLDGQSVRSFCYSNTPRADAVTLLLRQLCDEWREIRPLNDNAAAEMIRRDRIDILIDLTGHFGANRLGIFAKLAANN